MLTSRPALLSLSLPACLLLCVPSPRLTIFSHSLVAPTVNAPAGGRRFYPLLQKQPPAEAERLYSQALELQKQRRYAAAIQLAERSLAMLEKALGAKSPHVATVLTLLGQLYQRTGDYARAEQLHLRAVAIREKEPGEKNLQLARALAFLAGLYLEKDEHDRALQLFQRAAAILEKSSGPDDPELGLLVNNIALAHFHKTDYEQAEPLFRRALAIFEKSFGAEHPHVAMALDNLANVYGHQGEYARAEALFLRALAIREKVQAPDNPDLGMTLTNLAWLYDLKGEDERAEPLFQRALAIWEKAFGPEHQAVAAALNNIAEIYKGREEYERAEPLYRRALAISEKTFGAEHPLVASLLNNLGGLYRSKGDLAAAEPLHQRALAIYEKSFGAEHPLVAATLEYLGWLYQTKGDYARAEMLYRRALTIVEKKLGMNHPTAAGPLYELGTLCLATGDDAQAIVWLTRNAETSENILTRILVTGSESQKRLYLQKFTEDTNVNISLHLRSAPTSEEAARLALTTVLRRKGRVLDVMSDQIGSLRRRLDPQELALLDRLTAARTHYAELALKGPGAGDLAQYRAEVARLEGEAEQLEAQVSARSAEFRAQAQPVTLERVQQAIPEGAALVEIALYRPFNARAARPRERLGEERYAAYVLRRGGAPAFVDLGEAALINRRARELRVALVDRHSTDVKQAARALDDLVMRPVRPLLGGLRDVLISPDDALNLIPFGALVDERGRYLVEDYTFDYLTSGRDLLRLEGRTPSRQPPVIIADPSFDLAVTTADPAATPPSGDSGRRSVDLSQDSWPQLTGTSEEAAGIKRFFPDALVLTKTQATEAALKRVSGPRLLHVATHGFFEPDQPRETAARVPALGLDVEPRSVRGENPLLRSGLVLAGVNKRQSGAGEDGVLTALEATGLDLWGTRLVVLSACQTGEGDVSNGEGVYGLRRALVLAGAESELMSLWRVDDEAVRDLMLEYYQRLQAGESRVAALRQVQLKMLRGDEQTQGEMHHGSPARRGARTKAPTRPQARARSHPYFWASFIPIGDWRPLNEKRQPLAEAARDKMTPLPAGTAQPAVREREVTPRPTTSAPPAEEPKPQSAAELAAAGKLRYDTGDYASAASLFERALRLDPGNINAHVWLGDAYTQQTPPAYDRAIAEYRKALVINPRHEMAWQQLAVVALHKKSLLMARDAIEHLAIINPSNPELNRLRAALAALEL